MWLRPRQSFHDLIHLLGNMEKFDAQRAIIPKARKIVFVAEMAGAGEHGALMCPAARKCVA